MCHHPPNIRVKVKYNFGSSFFASKLVVVVVLDLSLNLLCGSKQESGQAACTGAAGEGGV
jgi:hypothetical protein